MDTSGRRKIIYCARCGKKLNHYHWLMANNGEYGFVCADDRLCGPWKSYKRPKLGKDKNKVLQKHKERWND